MLQIDTKICLKLEIKFYDQFFLGQHRITSLKKAKLERNLDVLEDF